MADLDDPQPGQRARGAPASQPWHARISLVWIVPIVAALAAGAIALQRVLSEGPTITIVFKSSPGIEAGKTAVKYKDVRIGLVTSVQLSGDRDTVEVKAKIAKSAAGLMVEDTKFWVVSPRISLGEISGLNTLLSGNYIGVAAGESGNEQSRFIGLDVPQVVAGAAGRQFVLEAKESSGLEMGSPVYFRRLVVGQVVAADLSADGGTVDVKVFINHPYDRFIYPDTRFWNASGLDVSVGTSGLDVRTSSLAELIAGGLEFDTPSSADRTKPAAASTAFTLHRDRPAAMRQPEAGARRYVVHFTESVQGLSVGAPVTFLGLPAGEVTDIGLTFDRARGDVRTRVEITLFPERLLKRLSQTQQEALSKESRSAPNGLLPRLVEKRGLRAQLKSVSLISDQRYVAMSYFPQASQAKVDWSREVPELPAIPGPLPDLEAKLASVLQKLDRVPYDAIGADLRKALSSLDRTLVDTGRLVEHVDADVVPRFSAALEDARKALAATERVMNEADAGLVGPDAPAQQELRNALQDVSSASRALRTLADSLERHPESLIRGRAASRE
jgi:paraquat-inducible protein B